MTETRWQDGPAVEAWMAHQQFTVVPPDHTVIMSLPRDVTVEELDMLRQVCKRKFGDRFMLITTDIDVTVVPPTADVRAVTHAEQ